MPSKWERFVPNVKNTLFIAFRAKPEHLVPMDKFGVRLREAAARAGYDSDAAAARGLRIEIRTYGNYVRGRVPDPETLARMCTGLGITPNHLFGFSSPGYQEEAASIAEQLIPTDRDLWFLYGRTIIGKDTRATKARQTRQKSKARRAS